MKHTPGPWKVELRTTRGQFVRETHIVSADKSHIAEVTPVNIEANAKLIAAAPELFEALKNIVEAHEIGMGLSSTRLRIEIAKDIIKKITDEK